MLEVILMTFTENSSVETNNTQGAQEYPHHWKQLQGCTYMCERCTKTTLVFLPADGEPSWLLLPGLLTITWHSASRKYLFLYPEGDRLGLRKPKRDMHQH